MCIYVFVRKEVMGKVVETGGRESCDEGTKQHKTPTIQL